MGQNREQAFPDNIQFTWTNGTGAAVTRDIPIRLNGRWVVPLADIANGASGIVTAAGRFRLTKANGVTIAAGDNIWWDSANNRISSTPVNGAAGFGDLLGRAAAAAGSSQLWVNVDVGGGAGVFAGRVTGNAGSGLAINTGLGVVPRAFSVISRQASGAVRAGASWVLGTSGSAGIITVTTTGGAADDTHDVIAHA